MRCVMLEFVEKSVRFKFSQKLKLKSGSENVPDTLIIRMDMNKEFQIIFHILLAFYLK